MKFLVTGGCGFVGVNLVRVLKKRGDYIRVLDNLSVGSRQILQKLLHRDPALRFSSAAELVAELAWWLDALRESAMPDAVLRLQDRVWDASSAQDYARTMAAAHLGLRCSPSDDARRDLEYRIEQAQQAAETLGSAK